MMRRWAVPLLSLSIILNAVGYAINPHRGRFELMLLVVGSACCVIAILCLISARQR